LLNYQNNYNKILKLVARISQFFAALFIILKVPTKFFSDMQQNLDFSAKLFFPYMSTFMHAGIGRVRTTTISRYHGISFSARKNKPGNVLPVHIALFRNVEIYFGVI